jgi:hypothetical protein
VEVKVDIEPRLLWALEERATREGITLPQLLLGAAVARFKPQQSTADRVKALWDRNFPDADIAEQLHITPGYVAGVRRDMGLPAHRRYQNKRKAS